MRLRLVVPVIAAGALVLAACGGDDDSGSDTTSAAIDADVVVKAVDPLKWDQPTYSATAGEVAIAVENDSSQPHNLHVLGPDNAELPLALDIPSKGDTDAGTISLTAGDYTLICTVPGHADMKSVLTVS